MPFHVHPGYVKDREFERYVKILSELGLPVDRDHAGRLGVVNDRETAERLLGRVRKAMPHLDWQIADVL